MKKDSELYKKIRVHCYIVGLIAFLTALIVGVFLLHNLEKDEKTTGKYMAQITEKRVRARLDQYIMLSDLLGNYISAGENLDENTFSELAEKKIQREIIWRNCQKQIIQEKGFCWLRIMS